MLANCKLLPKSMMLRFSLLATLFCLPLVCFGAGDDQCATEIANQFGTTDENITNYNAYRFQAVAAGDCNDLEQTCRATIARDVNLRGRTWFITNIKPSFGFGYDSNTIQDFRVACPSGTILHLAVQDSSLPAPDALNNCDENNDNVKVTATGLNEAVFCGTTTDLPNVIPELHNDGSGRLFADGKARVYFCSNDQIEGGALTTGFVIRATCLDPREFQLPSCVSDLSDNVKDDLADLDIDSLTIALPHRKRRSSSISERLMKKGIMEREKRGLEFRLLNEGDTITYLNNVLTVTFANGTSDPIVYEGINCLTARSDVVGTRVFRVNAPFDFQGAGWISIDTSKSGLTAQLMYTIPEDIFEPMFLAGSLENCVADLIYEYIYDNWILPYPVIDKTVRGEGDDDVFPLPLANCPPSFADIGHPGFLNVDAVNYIKEDIQSESGVGTCERAMRIEVVPQVGARVSQRLVVFCERYRSSCDLILRTACNELLRLANRI